MGTFAQCASVLSFVMAPMLVSLAGAQGQFSQAGAQAIINTKDWNRLLAYGKAWAQSEPNNADAWFVIGRAYGSKFYHIGLERPAGALPAFQKVVQLRPEWPDGWNALGAIEQELNQWIDAVVAFQHAVRLAPTRTQYWRLLSASYIHTHQFPQAAEATANLENYAKSAQDWFDAGQLYYGIGQYYQPTLMYQKSKGYFQRFLKLEPKNGPGWTNLGTTEEVLGNYQAALDDYKKGAQLGNALGGTNYRSLTTALQTCQNWKQSVLKNPGPARPLSIPVITYNPQTGQNERHGGRQPTYAEIYNSHCARLTGALPVPK